MAENCCGKTHRIASMLILVVLFCIIEVVVGYMTNSMALVTDSFHKLSDSIALVIALVAAVLSNRKTSSINTYGWIRAEVLGGLVNAVFLVALCFSIFVESLQRLISVEKIEDAELMAAVGGGSLIINVIGILLFIGYTPVFKRGKLTCDKVNDVTAPLIHKTIPHGDKMCDITDINGDITTINDDITVGDITPKGKYITIRHDDITARNDDITARNDDITARNDDITARNDDIAARNDDITAGNDELTARNDDITAMNDDITARNDDITARNDDITAVDNETGEESHVFISSSSSSSEESDKHIIEEKEMLMELPNVSSGAQLNMHGVFLHLLTDMMGSITIIVSALVITYGSGNWVLYFDPAISLVLVIVIICLAIPLLRESAYILLQMVPHHISVRFIRTKLKNKFPEIAEVHDFHVWRLEGDTIIATAHIVLKNTKQYSKISRQVKKFFHDHGIHSTTVQPEFLHERNLSHSKECILECGLQGNCQEPTCCNDKSDIKNPQTDQMKSVETESDIGTKTVTGSIEGACSSVVDTSTKNSKVKVHVQPITNLRRGVSKSYELLESVVSTI